MAVKRKVPFGPAALVSQPAQVIIAEIDNGQKAAEFYVAAQDAKKTVDAVWSHVQQMIRLEGKGKPAFVVGDKFVALDPYDYVYDLDVIRELAPQAVKTEFVYPASADVTAQIHELAGDLLSDMIGAGGEASAEIVGSWAEVVTKIVKLTQQREVESIDGRLVGTLMGRGDELAAQLHARKARVPAAYKISVKAKR